MTLLRDRRLAALPAAELVSSTGSQMTSLALPWFVLVTTGSASRMAWVVAAENRSDGARGHPQRAVRNAARARSTMVVCDVVRAPLVAAIPVLHELHALSFPLLLALVFSFGAFATPSIGAQAAIVPEIVGADARRAGKAMALFQGASRTTILLGAFGAGAIVGSVAVYRLLDRIAPLTIATTGFVFQTLPLFALAAFGARPVLLVTVCAQACAVAAWIRAGVAARRLFPNTLEVAT